MIDKHAIIDQSVKLGKNVSIGPFSVIGPNVEIGDNTVVGPHVVIKGSTRIGQNCRIFQFASIGEDCQDLKYQGEETWLEIGDRCTFRESCTVHRGTVQGGGITRIGHDSLFMAYSHVAHDCVIGNHVIFSNNASVAGHVKVDDYASLGGLVGVHQFCSIGKYSFAAGGAIIFKDLPPYIKASGYPASAFGLNTVGLERGGFAKETIQALKQAYRIIFRKSLTIKDAIEELKEMVEVTPEIMPLVEFLSSSERGIVR